MEMLKFAMPPLARRIARRGIILLMAIAIAVLILLVYLFWPKTTPTLRGYEPPKELPRAVATISTMPATRPATTEPATTQPVTAQRAGDILLYAPEVQDADPSWSLPAELKADGLRRLARQVDKLAHDLPETAQLESECRTGGAKLLDSQLVGLLWSRLMGRGFHDANLPLDWYEVVKDQVSLLGDFTKMADDLTNQAVQMAISYRVSSVQIRIIGGKVLVGDMLFVKAAQLYISQRRPYYERLLPLLQSVTRRANVEFRAELYGPQQQDQQQLDRLPQTPFTPH